LRNAIGIGLGLAEMGNEQTHEERAHDFGH
jgi:hypothetical protein